MVLKIIRSNHPFNFLLTVLLGTVFWSASLVNPRQYPFYEGEEHNILFHPIYNLVGNHAMPVVSLILVLVLGMFIQQINSRYPIIRERNKLPALLFVIMAGGLTSLHTLHPVYFAGILLAAAIYRLFSIFDNEKPHSASFDSGFLLGLGSLFYLNTLLLVPAFIISVGILSKNIRWKIFVIQLLGILLPFMFVFSLGALTDSLVEIFRVFERNITTSNTHIATNIFLQACLGLLTVLTVIGCIVIMIQYNTRKISSRKYLSVFFLILISSVAGIIIVPSVSQEMFIITFIPLSYLLSALLSDLKNRFLGGLIFMLLLSTVIFLQVMAFFG